MSILSAKHKIGLAFIALLLLLNIFTWQHVFVLAGPRYLKVEVLNVGQGDSIFIQTPAMRRILIDGGPDATVLSKLAKRLPFWEKSLDVIILTHPDQDHIMGLLSVLEKYHVGYIVWTGMVRDGANYDQWVTLLEKAKKRGSKIVIAKTGLRIASGGAVFDTLHPFETLEGRFFDKTGNDAGIIEKLQYGRNSFLFTADVSSNVEQQMVDVGLPVVSDVLKVGHHGSKYSSSELFLQAVNPTLAVISVGARNAYGHPTPEVLQRLQKSGIKILRTDQHGDMKFLSDGKNINIK